ncbi:chloride channel protein [Paenibacillus sp. B2(2019)]|uniref:chloride channel protein n=1 Tax=Paenibacillus sp. B2(2019) TaxID=2607754 RepID=UPI0011F275BD|nr:chloride channel protein [Paenibacillus sp. B2(2019)]KAA1186312.1 chloride channel protein [Paenibacillus sp. B2(2019)]
MRKFLGLSRFVLYSIIIGGVAGLLTWSFLAVTSLTTHFLWDSLPSVIDVQYWTIIVCLVGGILVGLCQKYFGDYPRNMEAVLGEFKETKRIDYSSGIKSAITALCVLSFGASLGPEAALVGIVGGLSTWAGDALKSRVKKKPVVNEYEDIIIEYSVETTIGMIFRSPLYGVTTFFEDRKDPKFIKLIKTLVYSITTAAGFGVFVFLSKIDNRKFTIADFGPASIGVKEIMAIIPLILIGVLLAKLYEFFGSFFHKVLKPLDNYKIVKAAIGGLVLGLIGTVLPLTLFSGEHELTELAADWTQMSIFLLLLLGIVKLFLTEFCLSTGWRGGHIFPIIFAGVSIGYGVAMLFPIDPVTSISIITTALTSAVLKKPIAVVLILMMIFPVKLIIPMILAAYLPIYMFKLKWLKGAEN